MKTKTAFFPTIFILFLCFNSFTCAAQTLPMFIQQDKGPKIVLLGASFFLCYTLKKNQNTIDIVLYNIITISFAYSLILNLYAKNRELHPKDAAIKKKEDLIKSFKDTNVKIINELKQSIESKKKTIEELENTNRLLKN